MIDNLCLVVNADIKTPSLHQAFNLIACINRHHLEMFTSSNPIRNPVKIQFHTVYENIFT